MHKTAKRQQIAFIFIALLILCRMASLPVQGTPLSVPPLLAQQPNSLASTISLAPPDTSIPTLARQHSGRLLPVSNINQYPQLRNGCEATAIAILLNYYGCTVSKYDVAYTYLPRVDFTPKATEDSLRTGPDPNVAYPGDPATYSGFYCFQQPAIQAIDAAMQQANLPYKGTQVALTSAKDFFALLDNGTPLLIWISIDNTPLRTEPAFAWRINTTGKIYEPYINCHALVVSGYNQNVFYLRDPRGEKFTLPHDTLMSSFAFAGKRAVVIL